MDATKRQTRVFVAGGTDEINDRVDASEMWICDTSCSISMYWLWALGLKFELFVTLKRILTR